MTDGKLILVIDDEEQMRELMCASLERAGFAAEAAANAEDGLARLRITPPPALVILDVMMPQMDGWAFLRAMSEGVHEAKVPAILCSAVVDLEHSQIPAGATIAGRLEKPFMPSELVALVKQALADAAKAGD